LLPLLSTPTLKELGYKSQFDVNETAWVAEFESRRRSERTLAGLARALQEGKKLGRPKGSKDKHKRNRGLSATICQPSIA